MGDNDPEHVRRRNRGPLPDHSEAFDTFKDVDPVKLRYWAAICLEFNFAEDTLTHCLSLVTGLDPWLGTEITSRLASIEAKFDIVKAYVKVSKTLSGEPATAISHSIGLLSSCKNYRDVIAHTTLHGPSADIVHTYVRKGVQYEADISTQTLAAVYAHTLHAGLEMAHAYRMIEHNWGEGELIPEGDTDPDDIRASEKFRLCLAQLRGAQSLRKNLPPIPEFPQGHIPYPDWALGLDPRRSAE